MLLNEKTHSPKVPEVYRRLKEHRQERNKPGCPSQFWGYLCDEGHVAECESGAMSIEDLSDTVDSFLDNRDTPAIRVRKDDWEFLASAGVDAEQANTNELVLEFRKAHLTSGLLDQREVAPWLSALEEEEREKGGTFTVELPVRREWLRKGSLPCIKDLKKILARLPANQPVGGRNEVLSFGVPDNRYPVFVLVADNGTTGELKRVAAALTATYGWQEGEAVVFILTGAVPLPAIARFTVGLPSTSRRISISVDARCAPERLAKEFAKIRNEVLGVGERGRYKPITSERSMRLALFGSAQREGSWGEKRQQWNSENPAWQYSDDSTFKRDTLRVLRRLAKGAAP